MASGEHPDISGTKRTFRVTLMSKWPEKILEKNASEKKDEVKEVGPRRGPRLLVVSILTKLIIFLCCQYLLRALLCCIFLVKLTFQHGGWLAPAFCKSGESDRGAHVGGCTQAAMLQTLTGLSILQCFPTLLMLWSSQGVFSETENGLSKSGTRLSAAAGVT